MTHNMTHINCPLKFIERYLREYREIKLEEGNIENQLCQETMTSFLFFIMSHTMSHCNNDSSNFVKLNESDQVIIQNPTNKAKVSSYDS